MIGTSRHQLSVNLAIFSCQFGLYLLEDEGTLAAINMGHINENKEASQNIGKVRESCPPGLVLASCGWILCRKTK